jgi:pantetheine-phosphate adenylyltransferase
LSDQGLVDSPRPHDERWSSHIRTGLQKTEGIVHVSPRFILKIRAFEWRDLSRSARPYKLVALGGTFDALHAGHRQLLSEAFKLGDVVLIGVTSDQLVRTLHKKHQVRSFLSRVRDLKTYLKTRHWLSRARVTALREPYGPAARRKKLQALIVSKGTLASGRRLNQFRRQNGLQPLDLRIVDLLRAGDGKPISTTRIRNGEIDLQGRVLKVRR